MKVEEAYRTPNRWEQKQVTTPYNNQNAEHTEQRENTETCKRKRASNIKANLSELHLNS